MKEQKWIREGLITEYYQGMFRVRLDNEDRILGYVYVSGRIRRNFIQILPGDRVKIEVKSL